MHSELKVHVFTSLFATTPLRVWHPLSIVTCVQPMSEEFILHLPSLPAATSPPPSCYSSAAQKPADTIAASIFTPSRAFCLTKDHGGATLVTGLSRRRNKTRRMMANDERLPPMTPLFETDSAAQEVAAKMQHAAPTNSELLLDEPYERPWRRPACISKGV